MKLSLILNAVNPRIGGVLICGEKGTAKSTAVRALAGVLPEIDIVQGCPFSCDPRDTGSLCPSCTEALADNRINAVSRPVRVVTLPLGATEDRVVGTLNIERAIREGISALDPGVLASVHRGILYIDEVNLLDDHIVDLLLDAAAMGMNIIEREGISVSHPSRFILVGTMNPEEGELRPQLLDRFGLMVSVEGITDPEERMAIIEAAESWEHDPAAVEQKQSGALRELRESIVRAQEMLPQVTMDKQLVRQVVDACLSLGIMTHRAEITVIRTAKTIAAFRGRTEVNPQDVREAMALALPHRMRKKPFEEPEVDLQSLEDFVPDSTDTDETQDHHAGDEPDAPQEQERESEGENDGNGAPDSPSGGQTQMHETGSPVNTAPVWDQQKPDRTLRKTARGRRIPTPTEDIQGRRTTVRQASEWKGLAIDATLRAAAPRQQERKKTNTALAVLPEDIRQVRRRGKAEVGCVFVVDASGSMGAEERMESAKGAVLSLLEDAYVNRDRIGLVAFRGDGAEVLLPLSRSPDLAYKRLSDLPTGGRTPLASGLLKGMELLRREKTKKRDLLPMMMLISDGRANAGSGPIREELRKVSGSIAEADIRTVVIDTEAVSSRQLLSLGYCREIAEISGGSYCAINDLSAEVIESIARQERAMFTGS
jgi:magnesium chelatase subunit D